MILFLFLNIQKDNIFHTFSCLPETIIANKTNAKAVSYHAGTP